ncbi:MAG TPA: molybdopterin cofactor-binding domain-containing protein, partial [Acidobacteriota bacterium]|nr:molybdopterin cofactor-binding domain-containing protein [Acidobacteriota bacterium]
MSSALELSRRSFLKWSAVAGGGFLLTLYVRSAASTESTSFVPGAFIRIDPDGTITLWSKNPDMGQGVKTSMPMILAEELEADWTRVKVEQADFDMQAYGDQGSGGSDSIRSSWDEHRRAGAVARQLLIQAAAETWKVPASECEARNSEVLHTSSGRKSGYGELAPLAAKLPLQGIQPQLKDPKNFRILGTRVRGVDNARIVTGQPLYGIDVHIPDMLYAVIARCPVYGGKPVSFDATAALQVAGVKQVFQFDGLANPTHLKPGVAVVATSTWAAIQGRKALKVTWDEGKHKNESTKELSRWFAETALKPGKILRETGHVDEALAASKFTLEADYEAPFLPHATMEPQNCTAYVRAGECEIWGPLQMPDSGQSVVAKATGIPAEKIRVHMTRLGGGFGRRLMSDYAAEAAVVSQKIRAPVQVLWTREDDIQHDYYRTASHHRVRAGMDAEG